MTKIQTKAIWPRLLVLPFLQAMFSGAVMLALSRQWYPAAWITCIALNLCWWQNIRMVEDTRHLRYASAVYSATIATGTVLGAWLIALTGGQ